MKSTNYIPEIVCLLLLTLFSCLWAISLKQIKTGDTQLSPLLALEKLIPRHGVELLNANFSDQLHYDQLAQLQSEVEALALNVVLSDNSRHLLEEYTETSLSYTQLASMLKTSQRLISEDYQFEDTRLKQNIDNIRLAMFAFISSTDKSEKTALADLLASVDFTDRQQENWQTLQLVKLHSLFLLENYELAATLRQQLIEMSVVDIIFQEHSILQQQINSTRAKQYIGVAGMALALILLIAVVIKRHERALKNNSELHKEFATNLMDMLGPQGENLKSDIISKLEPTQKQSRAKQRN